MLDHAVITSLDVSMRLDAPGAGMSLSGVAVLGACACATGSRMAHIGHSFGVPASLNSLHSLFVVLGSALIVKGLWPRDRGVAGIGTVAVSLLLLGEFLARPMSVHAQNKFISPLVNNGTGSVRINRRGKIQFPQRIKGHGLRQ